MWDWQFLSPDPPFFDFPYSSDSPVMPLVELVSPQKSAILAPCSSKIVTVTGDAGHGRNRDAGLK
jgi:hypothetical protein